MHTACSTRGLMDPTHMATTHAHTRGRALEDSHERAAARSAAAGRSGSRHCHSLIDLQTEKVSWGNRADTKSAPPLPTEWQQRWSGEDGNARQAGAFASMPTAHVHPHMPF